MQIAPVALALLLSTTSAFALQEPATGKDDPRMQAATYLPGQIYHLHLKIGHTLAIILRPDQTNNDSVGSDSAHIKTLITAGSNIVFLKPIATTAPKSFFIRATNADGTSTLYPFQVDVVPADGDSIDPYTLKFTDPVATANASAVAWRAAKKRQDERAAHQALVDAAANAVDTNLHYVLQGETAGDWNLLPTREVGDNGHDTHFHFPGVRNPIIYTVTPDGKEAVADCSPNSVTNVTTCHQLAAQWRLRDGDSELCVFDRAFDPVGVPTPSNTSSPSIVRTLKVGDVYP